MQPISSNNEKRLYYSDQREKYEHDKMLLSLAAIESKLKEFEDEKQLSFLEKTAKYSSSLRTVFLNILVILIFICIFIVAWKGFSTDYLIVEKINLPKPLNQVNRKLQF